jgi:hypothetical protein
VIEREMEGFCVGVMGFRECWEVGMDGMGEEKKEEVVDEFERIPEAASKLGPLPGHPAGMPCSDRHTINNLSLFVQHHVFPPTSG